MICVGIMRAARLVNDPGGLDSKPRPRPRGLVGFTCMNERIYMGLPMLYGPFLFYFLVFYYILRLYLVIGGVLMIALV